MPTIVENKQKEFIPHPEGQFLAVMRDAYLQERPNPWKGQQRDKKDPSKGIDTRETITEIILEFLTDHIVEVDGDMLPGFVRYKASATTSEGSNLRGFLGTWFPQLKDEDFKRFDADKLIGRGAYITVAHSVDKKGNTWANIVGAMQPPKGSELPVIPQGFVRHQDRPENKPAEVAQTAPAPIGGDDGSDLPF